LTTALATITALTVWKLRKEKAVKRLDKPEE
jgi:hypothetical protein